MPEVERLGGGRERADDAAAKSRKPRRVHRRARPRQTVRQALHRGEALGDRSQRHRRGFRLDTFPSVLSVLAEHGGGVEQVDQGELAGDVTRRDLSARSNAEDVVVILAKRDPANDRGVLPGAEPDDVRARALHQLGVDHGPRVGRAGNRVAVQVPRFILPKRVLFQNSRRHEPPEMPRWDELLPPLGLRQVPGDDQGRGRGAEAGGREEVALSRVLQRGMPVGVHVREAPRSARRKHERPAPPTTVALHPVHLHQGRIAQDDNLGERPEGV